jgi:hypothetical protein
LLPWVILNSPFWNLTNVPLYSGHRQPIVECESFSCQRKLWKETDQVTIADYKLFTKSYGLIYIALFTVNYINEVFHGMHEWKKNIVIEESVKRSVS